MLLFAGALMLSWGGVLGVAVQTNAGAASPAAVNQCNGTDNVGGQAVACSVSVINNLDLGTGAASSTVTLTECHGAANAAPTCTNTPITHPNQLTTTVTQCNGSGSGGGGTVTCSVRVTNNITGTASTSPASIDQCNGSGAGGGTQPTVACTPIGNTTNATITQCDNSGNGGGGTRRVRCTVGPSTQTAALPVTVDQCNGSGNGGGGTVTCTVTLVNNIISAPVTTPPVTTPPVTTPPVTTPPVTAPPVSSPPFVPPPGLTGDSRPSARTTPSYGLLGGGVALIAGGVALLVPRRRR